MKISGYGILPDPLPTSRPFGEAAHLNGLGVAPGIAIGPIYIAERGAMSVPHYEVPEDQIEAECARFAKACEGSVRQVEDLIGQVEGGGGPAAEELAELLGAHVHMLQGSRLVRGAEARIRDSRINAEAAVQAVISEISEQYAAIEDAYLAGRVHDVQDVGARLIRNLVHAPVPTFSNLPEGCILLSEEITPADTALLDPQRVGGFATALGGAESHTAIMARSLGIPAVLGITDWQSAARNGDLAILDGELGNLIVNPSQAEVDKYQARKAELKRDQQRLGLLKSLPAVTTDKKRIKLSVNLELPSEVALAKSVGAEGIGLVRTEFMFMNRPDLPSEDEQFHGLSDIVAGAEGQTVTIRTLDVGGEKIAHGMDIDLASEGANPALGLRAIRFSLVQRDLFERQIAAILRVSALGDVRILLPMITTVTEVKQARRMIESVYLRLKSNKAADFFSIGTNDLTQYTLAIDRANEQVAPLYDGLNPAVLRLIQFATNAAIEAGIPVNLCGEMAGDDRLTPLLLGLGLEELSMNAPALPKVKRRIRELDSRAAADCATRIMAQSDRAQIAALLSDFNELAFSE
jgi:phosphotransferase system enzyme I (PtsI)